MSAKTTNEIQQESQIDLLSEVNRLRDAWQEKYSKKAEGGLVALRGFEFQFLLTLLKVISRWKEASETERQNQNTANEIFAEAISDIAEITDFVIVTQAKQTLSYSSVRQALAGLKEIFDLACELTPDLANRLQFVISGKKFEGQKNPQQIIREWDPKGNKLNEEEKRKLDDFKARVKYEVIPDPKAELTIELENLNRDEDTETTIARWLGYLLQLGYGLPPERIMNLIWLELLNDASLQAFRGTLARLLSQSRYRLGAIRHTFGRNIRLPRTNLLSEFKQKVFANRITLLLGPSGSGKSALCKLGMSVEKVFEDHTCLFLDSSDIFSFTETPDSNSKRDTRRLDELLTSQIIGKTIVIIDDVDNTSDPNFNSVLNLIQNVLAKDNSAYVRFVLAAHLDSERTVRDKISNRLGTKSSIEIQQLPPLPIDEIRSSDATPKEVANLVQRHGDFGPALNLKLLDWVIIDSQENRLDASSLRNDLDILNWFWRDRVGNGREDSQECQVLIEIAQSLAEKFAPDLALNKSPGDPEIRNTLVRRDCLRIVEKRVGVTHRFVGDCARFSYLVENRRELEVSELATLSKNPLWSQPISWFALYLAMESEETWRELLQESYEGNYSQQLINLLLDGAIASKKPSSVFQGIPKKYLPSIVDPLLSRLLAIATLPHPALARISESRSAAKKLAIQQQTTGIPKADLWEPIWSWLLSQNQTSCLVFRAAEAWLNWGEAAVKFPLRKEVATFVLNLAEKVLLPEPNEKNHYYSDDFSSNAFACIVFAIAIIPERSAWLLRVLARREIVTPTRLAPTATSRFFGKGTLEIRHPKGPLAQVNKNFRKFMLKQNGFYLGCVIRRNPELGAELLLALTIKQPGYRYENDNYHRKESIRNTLGTSGSDEIGVCWFNFLPLVYLLQIDETLAIDVIGIVCKVAAEAWQKSHQRPPHKNASLDKSETDADELTLLIDGTRKRFIGGRDFLYWHRNYFKAPKIVACFLMTLENWLYSRPTKLELERCISEIFKRTDTVAVLGVLVSLAKSDFRLLRDSLLPLVSSLQLTIWLSPEYEVIDYAQDYGFNHFDARRNLTEEEYEQLQKYHRLPHRKKNLQEIILNLWINKFIPLEAQAKILDDWDKYQLESIPEISRDRATRIRLWYEHSNWQQDKNDKTKLAFVGTLPEVPDAESKAESTRWNLQCYNIVMMSRQILDKEIEKTLDMHDEVVDLLTSEDYYIALEKHLESQKIWDVMWAKIAIILEEPTSSLPPELEDLLDDRANDLTNLPLDISNSARSQTNDLNTGGFIARVSPKLLSRIESENVFRSTAFRCFIGWRNCNTSTFMRSWIKQYGILHPLTQEFIKIAPLIARFMILTDGFLYAKSVQQNMMPDGTYILPQVEEEITAQEEPLIEEFWSIFEQDFIEKNLPKEISLVEAFNWTPESFEQYFQEIPDCLRQSYIDNQIDWEFLAAAFIPVLELEPNNKEIDGLVNSLCQQILDALLCERKIIFTKYTVEEQKLGHSHDLEKLNEAQVKLLDGVFTPQNPDICARIDLLLSVFQDYKFVDCDVLWNVTLTLRYSTIEKEKVFPIANAIGKYLFSISSEKDIEKQFFASFNDIWKIWENLISFLSQEQEFQKKNATHTDLWLAEFFNNFKDILLPKLSLRMEMYRVAKLTRHQKLRRKLFTYSMQQQELLPTYKNDESKLLVEVIAEFLASDKAWIQERQPRLNDLKTLLEHLQEIDAPGARILGDSIAKELAHPSN